MRKFRGEKSLPDLEERTTILVDDGLASGYSMLTTAQALESHKPKEVLVAIPTAPLSAIDRVKTSVDRIYCLNIRTGSIFAVASAYKNWRDLSDEEILSFLEKH
ncbi:MAG: phosphoribosyltransferase family protein [Candidatus Bathyarchaeia archaeon]